MGLYEKGNYVEAVETFSRITDYEDSEEMMLQAKYSCAKEYYKKEIYDEAQTLLSEIVDYKDSEELLTEIWYKSAVKCMEAAEYEKALELIKKYEASTLRKSMEMENLLLQKKQIAEVYKNQGEYEMARGLYQELGEIWDEAEMSAKLGEYVKALELTKEFKCDSTQKRMRQEWQRIQGILFMKEGNYKDAWECMQQYKGEKDKEWCEAAYKTACALAENKQYEEAVELSIKAQVHVKETEKLLKECYQELGILHVETDCETAWKYLSLCDATEETAPYLYKVGIHFMENELFESALAVWEKLGTYQDTASNVAECYYNWAIASYENRNYEEARNLFSSIPEYEDSAEWIVKSTYEWAKQLDKQKEYEAAEKLFITLGDYEDSQEWVEGIRKYQAEKKLQNQWKERISVLEGTWETDDKNLRIYVYDGELEMLIQYYTEVAFGRLHYFSKIKVDWDELPPGMPTNLGFSTVSYTYKKWDYSNGYLYVDGTIADCKWVYRCTINNNKMVFQIGTKSFTLTKK